MTVRTELVQLKTVVSGASLTGFRVMSLSELDLCPTWRDGSECVPQNSATSLLKESWSSANDESLDGADAPMQLRSHPDAQLADAAEDGQGHVMSVGIEC